MDYLKTNIKELDEVLGNGLPIGRIVEIAGKEDVFKSTLCFNVIKNLTNQDKLVLYINLDNDLNINYINKFNINNDFIFIINSNRYIEIIDLIKNIIPYIDIIIFDSIANIYPIEKINNLIKLCSNIAYSNNISILLINQLKTNMKTNKVKAVASNMINYYSSIRLRLEKKNSIVKHYQTIGYNIKIKTIKNKIFNLKEDNIKLYF